MDRTFDLILTFGAVLIGILLLTGNGGFFMKGGNSAVRKVKYDQKKMEKSSGIALILVGLATGIDAYTEGLPAKVAYIVVLLVIFGTLFWYIRTKCRIKKQKQKRRAFKVEALRLHMMLKKRNQVF